MEIELLDEPTTELTVTARAALALSSEKTRAEPVDEHIAGPIVESDPIFNQEDGSDLLDGPYSPSDAEVIAVAANAVACRYSMSFNDALNRLAEIQEWIVAETT